MLVYVAGPLFNQMELERNAKVAAWLRQIGFDVYLPQTDVGVTYDLIDHHDKTAVRSRIFRKDEEAIRSADIVLCLLDGRVPDEGTCVELGMAYALGKICVGLKTDKRAMDINGDNNVMIDGCLHAGVARSLDELERMLTQLKTEPPQAGRLS